MSEENVRYGTIWRTHTWVTSLILVQREPKSLFMVGEREKEKGMGIRQDEGEGGETRPEGR